MPDELVIDKFDDHMDQLLAALRVSDDKVFRIKVMEALGMLTLTVHWLRGMLFTMEHFKAIHMNDSGWNGYRILRDHVEEYEGFLWRIIPPRAMIQQLGVWREKGYLDEEFEKLLLGDFLGRAHYHPKEAEIRDVMGRVISQDTRAKPKDEVAE